MDVRFLATFLEVAQTKHFGKAADNLFLTQSAVSARIKLLEEYFGTALFVRHRHSIQLSVAGEKLIPFAKSLQSTLNQAKKTLNQAELQHINVASTTNAFNLFGARAVSHLQSAHTELSMRVDIANIEQISRQLHEHLIDFAFSTQLLKSDDIISQKLYALPMKLFAAKAIVNSTSFDPSRQISDKILVENYLHIEWTSKISDSFFKQTNQAKSYKLSTTALEVALPLLNDKDYCTLLPQILGKKLGLVELDSEQNNALDIQLDCYIHYMKGIESTAAFELVSEILKTALDDKNILLPI